VAISSVETYGLLNRWQIRMKERIWPFNQVNDGFEQNDPAVYIQFERDMLAEALRDAFETASYYLGYNPRPIYETVLVHFTPNRAWETQILALDKAYLQAFGSRSTTLVEAGATVTYSDADGDAIHDTGTLTILNVAAVDTDDVRLFFRVADGAVSAAESRYEVPIKSISKSGSTITITVERAHCVKPSFWDLYPFENGDPRNRRDAGIANGSTNFVSALDVYTETTSSTGAVTLLSYPAGSDDTVIETDATGILTDAEASEFMVKIGSGQSQPRNTPYAVRVNVLSGRSLMNNQILAALETAIIRLANTNVLLEQSALAFAIRELWREDNEMLFKDGYIPREYANPLGVKKGHLSAWTTFVSYRDKVKGHVFV
jgi:hypothetical protein